MVNGGGGGVVSGTPYLGAAASDDGGASWEKLDFRAEEGGTALDPGGPIVSPGSPGAWCEQVIGTPYLVACPGGELRLYHCGKTTETNMSIGLLVSDSGDVGPGAWRPVWPGSE